MITERSELDLLAAPARKGTGLTATEEGTMLAYTLTARDMRHARSAYDAFARAWSDCKRTQQAVTVWFWDAVSDPVEPGWVLRTFRYADGNVTSTDERASSAD